MLSCLSVFFTVSLLVLNFLWAMLHEINLIMAALWNRAGRYIFALLFILSCSFFLA